METIITKRGKAIKLFTIPEWYERMEQSMGRYPDLVALEQAYFQSRSYKVCVACLSPNNLELETRRALIKSTDYYMCQDCLDYYDSKNRAA